MDDAPDWLDREAIADQLDELADRREAVSEKRSACLDAIDDDDLERAEQAKRAYQLQAYRTRQQEGEILWAALGYAISDLVDSGIDPSADGAVERGTAFVDWAVESEILSSIHSQDRVELILARRFPTVPDAHEPYAKSMFGLSDDDVTDVREKDRRMLQQAGWLRRGRRRATDRAFVNCAHCDGRLPVNIPEGTTPQSSTAFTGDDDEMREICPHCEQDLYVAAVD